MHLTVRYCYVPQRKHLVHACALTLLLCITPARGSRLMRRLARDEEAGETPSRKVSGMQRENVCVQPEPRDKSPMPAVLSEPGTSYLLSAKSSWVSDGVYDYSEKDFILPIAVILPLIGIALFVWSLFHCVPMCNPDERWDSTQLIRSFKNTKGWNKTLIFFRVIAMLYCIGDNVWFNIYTVDEGTYAYKQFVFLTNWTNFHLMVYFGLILVTHMFSKQTVGVTKWDSFVRANYLILICSAWLISVLYWIFQVVLAGKTPMFEDLTMTRHSMPAIVMLLESFLNGIVIPKHGWKWGWLYISFYMTYTFIRVSIARSNSDSWKSSKTVIDKSWSMMPYKALRTNSEKAFFYFPAFMAVFPLVYFIHYGLKRLNCCKPVLDDADVDLFDFKAFAHHMEKARL